MMAGQRITPAISIRDALVLWSGTCCPLDARLVFAISPVPVAVLPVLQAYGLIGSAGRVVSGSGPAHF
jgi:hypothetical protein